ncbi:hypothetical protein [Actinoplanes xinjiangensis]|uniref:hypothetical protein n=1 Tax=Actinoplanes xinjiangensis TaxID=512350 RepID=UPI003435118C
MALRRNRGPQRPVQAFSAADCRAGTAPTAIRIRVEHVSWSRPATCDGEPWYPVIGTEINSSGEETRRITILVRGRLLSLLVGNVGRWRP